MGLPVRLLAEDIVGDYGTKQRIFFLISTDPICITERSGCEDSKVYELSQTCEECTGYNYIWNGDFCWNTCLDGNTCMSFFL